MVLSVLLLISACFSYYRKAKDRIEPITPSNA